MVLANPKNKYQVCHKYGRRPVLEAVSVCTLVDLYLFPKSGDNIVGYQASVTIQFNSRSNSACFLDWTQRPCTGYRCVCAISSVRGLQHCNKT
jgi:hypothetical protein